MIHVNSDGDLGTQPRNWEPLSDIESGRDNSRAYLNFFSEKPAGLVKNKTKRLDEIGHQTVSKMMAFSSQEANMDLFRQNQIIAMNQGFFIDVT